jgi:hypothetical protein
MSISLLMSKMMSLQDARNLYRRIGEVKMDDEYEDRRRDARAHSVERLFVQIVACDDHELVGTTVSCNALDVSASGLALETGSSIPDGCRLDIWVDIASRPGKFFLSSDVKWSQTSSDGTCQLGVELREGATTDIEEWRFAHS